MDESAAGPPLPPLRDVIARHGLTARKGFGQNFLLDLNLTARIARAAAPLAGTGVFEVGPGPGGLTRALLDARAREVVAVERDRRCIAALAELTDVWPGRLRVIEADALEADPVALVAPPRKIIANLPYNIATPLLIGWLRQARSFESMTLMFQKEVALRLAAAPGSADYGRLSVIAQWACAVTLLFDIPPRAFVPSPKVTSSVVRLVPRREPTPVRLGALERVTAAAFGQRRKMVRSSLKTLGVDETELLAAAGVDPTARAESLSVDTFCRLAGAYDVLIPIEGPRRNP